MTSDFGHYMIVGPTNSGKTQIAKHLLREYTIGEPYIFAGVANQWNGYKVVTEGFDEFVTKLSNDGIKKAIVFDDYKIDLDTIHNKNYQQLITQGRHIGVTVMILCHSINSSSPLTRSNTRYLVLCQGISKSDLNIVSKNWMLNNMSGVTKILDRRDYTTAIIDANTKRIRQLKAIIEPVKEPITVELPITLPETSTLNTNPSAALYNNVSPGNISFANKSAHNLVDNSVNSISIETIIKTDQKVLQNQINNTIKLENIKHEQKETLYRALFKVSELAYKQTHTYDEKSLIVATLNRTLRPNIPYDFDDYLEGLELFMKTYVNKKYALPKKSIISHIMDIHKNSKDPVSVIPTIMELAVIR